MRMRLLALLVLGLIVVAISYCVKSDSANAGVVLGGPLDFYPEYSCREVASEMKQIDRLTQEITYLKAERDVLLEEYRLQFAARYRAELAIEEVIAVEHTCLQALREIVTKSSEGDYQIMPVR